MAATKSPQKLETPQNTEAEASLLGAILIDPDAIVKIADVVQPDDFFDTRHKYIYEAIVRLYERREAIDVLTLADQLKNTGVLDIIGGASYLTELTNYVPTASHVEQYAEIVAQKAVRRRLIAASQDMVELGHDQSKGLKELIEEAEARLFQISTQHVKQSVVSIESILAESFERLDELHKDSKKIRPSAGWRRACTALRVALDPSVLAELQRQTAAPVPARSVPSVSRNSWMAR